VERYLFEGFPGNPAANAVRNWRTSFEHVIATGEPHQIALQHYDVLGPEMLKSAARRPGPRLRSWEMLVQQCQQLLAAEGLGQEGIDW
jgi:hypothetical protein